MKIYRDNVPFDAVKATVINYFVAAANATKSQDWYSASWLSYYLDVAVKDMKEHPNKVEDEDYTAAVQTYEKMSAENFPKWRAVMTKEWKEQYAEFAEKSGVGPAAIPKEAASNAKLEGEMIAIAKTIYDDGRVPVKAIIKYADWNYTHNAFGQIIDRYHTGYIIFKMQDGSHRMVDIGFKQLYNGGSYGKTQLRGIGLLNQTVDYK